MDTLHTIAFYNLENLFDTTNDPEKLDDDFTPEGKYAWSKTRYRKKTYKLAKVIADIAKDETNKPPVLVGVVEVENATVLQDLIDCKPIQDIKYEYVHYNSPDERGIDVAMLYNPKYFTVAHSETIPIKIIDNQGKVDATRDGLYVRGLLNKEEVHVFVCHWPSRRGSSESTNYKRVQAAKQITHFIENCKTITEDAKIIIMGDFNDGPANESIEKYLVTNRFYNPFESLKDIVRGSLNYNQEWILFDQIIISHNFLRAKNGQHSFKEANIFDKSFLKEFEGKHEGNPFRTYKGKRYIGGYSDHFPVYVIMKLRS